jgi:hypothetical protein
MEKFLNPLPTLDSYVQKQRFLPLSHPNVAKKVEMLNAIEYPLKGGAIVWRLLDHAKIRTSAEEPQYASHRSKSAQYSHPRRGG